MIDNEKTGRQIALLRKEKGLTGEHLAELLDVSAQAVSKWENGKCLPETSLLPKLAKELGCSTDSLLMPQELLILSAVYSDGITNIDVTQMLNNLINANQLNIMINNLFLGISIQSKRLKVLTVKFQNPCGVYYSYAVQGSTLILDTTTKVYTAAATFEIIGAYYGNSDDYCNAIQRIKHYEHYKWDYIHANHENFFSCAATDDMEYLTLIYVNNKGIFTVSCEEDESLYYSNDRTALFLKDRSSCMLPGIMTLDWGRNMDCTWGGALYAALRHLGDDITYEQIMGLSGACYRLSFTEVWDWSTVDALVCYDYSSILFKAIGYEQIWAGRIEKVRRKSERRSIMDDIEAGKPVIAINLRIAPEWGVITGYLENGKRLLCRTYFDSPVFNEHKDDKGFLQESGGYLETDGWPYLIVHFGSRHQPQNPLDNLAASLKALVESFNAPVNRGYYQGKEAYLAWIKGLQDESAWIGCQSEEGIFRRMAVNDYMLLNLIDARRCAAIYLKGNVPLVNRTTQEQIEEIAGTYAAISQKLSNFRNKVISNSDKEIQYNVINSKGVSTHEMRLGQIKLLEEILGLEEQVVKKAEQIIL